MLTVVPRSGETASGPRGAAAVEAITVAVGVAAARGVAAKISSLRILPPTPVPLIVARFTPASAANFRTIGVTYASSARDELIGAAATGAGAIIGAGVTAGATGAGVGIGVGAGVATGATGVGLAAGAVEPETPIEAKRAPTATVESTGTSILNTVPDTGEGISVSTLSVETSSNASSAATASPTFFNHLVTVPSVTDSPNAGIETIVAPLLAGAGVGVET